MSGDVPGAEGSSPSPAPGAADAATESSAAAGHGHGHGGPMTKAAFVGLAVGSVGVVFGDIGTSPLYAMREALHHASSGVSIELAVLGVVSLVFWALLPLVEVAVTVALEEAPRVDWPV